MKRLALAALMLAVSMPASAIDFDLYAHGGAGFGQSSLRVGDNHCDGKTCGASAKLGALVSVEVGAVHGPWAVFLNHVSNPTTTKDVGTTMLGVKYELRGRVTLP